MGYRHHGVPYFSQWADPLFAHRIVTERLDPCGDPAWRTSGFTDEEDYRFWSNRICGLACLRSILEYWEIDRKTHKDLLQEALASGAYVVRPDGGIDGLTYAPFARWLASSYGLEVKIHPLSPLDDLISEIKSDAMVIASVSTEIRYPSRDSTQRGGHLVLVHGSDDAGVWIHNPSGVTDTQADAYVSKDDFSRFFANRGMAIRHTKQVDVWFAIPIPTARGTT